MEIGTRDTFVALLWTGSVAGLFAIVAGLAEHQHVMRDVVAVILLGAAPLATIRSAHARSRQLAGHYQRRGIE
jgi:hypothetical protein